VSALHLKVDGAIAELHLDNPEKLNAFTIPMLESLEAHCHTLERSPEICVVLLTAEGDRAFCAGADIKAWGELSPFEFSRNWVRDGHRVFNRLARLFQPTIAVISGHAFGGGLELATACDLRISSPLATFALPETSIGVVPGWSGSQRLAGHIPPAILKEMALLGNRLTAERAYEIGFVNEIAQDPYAAALEMAEKITSKSPRANEVAKYMIQAALGEDTESMIEALGGGMISASQDNAEGVLAFREKRKPDFPGN
jgi:enoyl-CoA hydratase/carnithine racemase